MRVLLIEDSRRLRESLSLGLKRLGYALDLAADGEEGYALASSGRHDVVILDLMLPKLDGISLLRRLREKGSDAHVLILTAKDAVPDRVAGLQAGADDYLVKPFAFSELLARLRALTRRQPALQGSLLRMGDLTLDSTIRQALRQGNTIPLTTKEYALLEYLMRHPHQVLTRTMIAEHVWNYDFDNATNVIDVHIRNLRRKIDDAFPTKLIHTVRGAGYRISDRQTE